MLSHTTSDYIAYTHAQEEHSRPTIVVGLHMIVFNYPGIVAAFLGEYTDGVGVGVVRDAHQIDPLSAVFSQKKLCPLPAHLRIEPSA